jgi:serine/threonine protein kinase
MVKLILDGEVKYDDPIWETTDESAKDFVKRLLVVNPKERMTGKDAATHEWLEKREVQPEETPSDELLSQIQHCLLDYKNTSSLKKIALNVIAHQSTTADIKQLRKVFTQLDEQHNGVLSYNEFRNGLVKVLHYSNDDIDTLFSSMVSDTTPRNYDLKHLS